MKWRIEQVESETASRLVHDLDLPPLLASILISRGMYDPESARAFLNPSLRDLPDPFLLPDIDKATDRLLQALKAKERITIYGDYDADGLTATALLADFFQKLD
ncbi:MAG: single-stranded-DNA-specific exonuclease RecJ, partial [Deltaproteobacteria bacterium]|nr:single-stranded-DNA-specific exonuclease RecJ [Deltaproteobacteria bacterium]